jgi:hypothetical protein
VDEPPFDSFETALFCHLANTNTQIVFACFEDFLEGGEIALFKKLIQVERLR